MIEQKHLVKKTTLGSTLAQPVLWQERELMALGAKRNWPFRVLGMALPPTSPIYHNNWWLVPVAQDRSQIPSRSLERVHAIYEAGIRPKAFVIAHEAPAQLPVPANAPKISKLEVWSRQLAEYSVPVIKAVGTAMVTVVVPLVLAALGTGLVLGLGFMSAVLTDPCLIAVTEDDVWIQIDYWMV